MTALRYEVIMRPCIITLHSTYEKQITKPCIKFFNMVTAMGKQKLFWFYGNFCKVIVGQMNQVISEVMEQNENILNLTERVHHPRNLKNCGKFESLVCLLYNCCHVKMQGRVIECCVQTRTYTGVYLQAY